jgi:hypothetical protein
VFLPLIQSSRGLSVTFWAKPRWFFMASFYQNLLALTASGAIFLFVGVLLLLTIYAIVCSSVAAAPRPRAVSRIPAYELVAALGYLAIPGLAVLLAKLVTGAFTDRYAIAAVLGLAMIIPWGAYVILDRRATMGIALAAALFSWFVYKDGIEPVLIGRQELAGLHGTFEFLRTAAPGDLPLVIASPHVFFQLSHYAPPELASRFVYLVDTAASLRYLKTNTAELGMQEFRRWTPMLIQDYRSYVRAHPRFLLYGGLGAGRWPWLVPHLVATRARLRLLAVDGAFPLFLVDTAGGADSSVEDERGDDGSSPAR